MKRELNDEQFSKMREVMTAAECATKVLPLASINLDENSIGRSEILVGGTAVKVSQGFFTRLAGLVKMSSALTNEMVKNNDGRIASTLINGLKSYRQEVGKGDGTIMLIANTNTREVVDICDPKRFRRMTNASVLDVTERILNENPNMSIETIDWNPNTGQSAINLLNNSEVGFPGAGKDEFFKFGFSIIQTGRDTMVETYNQRLVCSNGMRVSLGQGQIGGNREIQFEERFRLGGSDDESIRQFLLNIENMKRQGFVPQSFESTLAAATGTRASLLEVESAMLTAQRLVRENDPDLKKLYIDSVGAKFFHGHGEAINKIKGKGIDPWTLNEKQKSFIRTGMSVWDVVNSVTFLGSNNSGYELSDKHQLKSMAGQLFGKGTRDGFDLQYAQLAQL